MGEHDGASKNDYLVLRKPIREALRQKPLFVMCCLAAHRQGLLSLYLKGDRSTVDYIEENVFVLLELFDHPLFRFDWARQVKEGIIAAYNAIKGTNPNAPLD